MTSLWRECDNYGRWTHHGRLSKRIARSPPGCSPRIIEELSPKQGFQQQVGHTRVQGASARRIARVSSLPLAHAQSEGCWRHGACGYKANIQTAALFIARKGYNRVLRRATCVYTSSTYLIPSWPSKQWRGSANEASAIKR